MIHVSTWEGGGKEFFHFVIHREWLYLNQMDAFIIVVTFQCKKKNLALSRNRAPY